MDQAQKPKFDGQEFNLGGTVLVVPSLSVKQAKQFWPVIMELNQGVSVEQFPVFLEKSLPLIHAALTRNYPQLTLAELEELVDLANFRDLVRAIAAQSGLREVRPGEAIPVAK